MCLLGCLWNTCRMITVFDPITCKYSYRFAVYLCLHQWVKNFWENMHLLSPIYSNRDDGSLNRCLRSSELNIRADHPVRSRQIFHSYCENLIGWIFHAKVIALRYSYWHWSAVQWITKCEVIWKKFVLKYQSLVISRHHRKIFESHSKENHFMI